MAFSAPTIISNGTGTLGATHTTGTYTPAANARQLIAGCAYRDGGLTCNKPTITDSAGHTWTELASKHTSNNTTKDMWIVLWQSDTTGPTPAGRTITISSASATGCLVVGASVNAYDGTGALVQAATGEDLTAGDPAFTFGSAPAATNIVYGVVFASGTGLHTPPTGYTEQADTTVLTSHKLESFYDISSAAQGPNTPTSANTRSISVAVELLAAPSITAPTNKVNGTHTGGASHTTASFTPDANTRLLVTGSFANQATLSAPTITDSVGLTWTAIVDKHSSNNTTADLWIKSWYSNDVGASPAAMTITVGAATAANSFCAVAGILAAEVTMPPVQTATGEDLAAGDPAFTFASPTGGKSLVYAACCTGGNNGVTPPTGFTEQVDNATIVAREFETSYRLSGISTGPHAVTTPETRGIIIAFEIAVVSPTGDQALTPGLLTNTQIFYAPQVSYDQTLTPGLFSNAQTFYAPTVTRGAVTLTPGLHTNVQAFFAPTVAPGAVTLTPGLYTNPQTFYGPTVAPGPVTLTPGLFTNAQTFYAPTVTRGAVTLTPGLHTNVQTFFAPTVTVGAVTLTPGLFTNTQTFYAPTVTRGAVTLTPGLHTNVQTFFAPAVSLNLLPGLFTNSQTFYAPTVTRGAVTLTPGLFTNTQTFYAPVVTQAGGPLFLAPPLLVNDQTFYAPTVTTGPVTLTPGLHINVQAFFAPQVTLGAVTLTPGLYTNPQTFYAPTVTRGPVELIPGLFINSQIFYAPTVTRGPVTLTPGLFVNQQTFYAPEVSQVGAEGHLTPGLLTNVQIFYAPNVFTSDEEVVDIHLHAVAVRSIDLAAHKRSPDIHLVGTAVRSYTFPKE